ncbi:MAG: HAMP domain-containing histidine kinase, partial [Desulfatitalea sp.]|nr:HAMP domain-containing histidine kinase [Desulfatitalea sp.]
PLDSIMGFSRMLKEHVHDKAKIELYTGIIGSSSNQILSVVSDLIDIARIDEGRFQLNYERIDLNMLLDEMEELYKIRLRTSNKGHIVFNVVKGRDGVCEIISDKARLKQILYNLLNNSVKFTAAGEITLSYELSPYNALFRISDTGIGIDSEKRDIIFERFRQGDEGVARTFGGIGLGRI